MVLGSHTAARRGEGTCRGGGGGCGHCSLGKLSGKRRTAEVLNLLFCQYIVRVAMFRGCLSGQTETLRSIYFFAPVLGAAVAKRRMEDDGGKKLHEIFPVNFQLYIFFL